MGHGKTLWFIMRVGMILGALGLLAYPGRIQPPSSCTTEACIACRNAGCIYHKGWDGVHYVDRGYACGHLVRPRNQPPECVIVGGVVTSTISRSLRSGDPDFYIPPFPYCTF